jgi:hypothetical protein
MPLLVEVGAERRDIKALVRAPFFFISAIFLLVATILFIEATVSARTDSRWPAYWANLCVALFI